MTPLAITIGLSYLLGSIPFGYLLVRVLYGEDVRTVGSGNIGATNVSRKSPWLGLLTLLLDAGKGYAAVVITMRLFPIPVWMAGLAAFSAIVGHSFSIWLKFGGGKGVATGLGSFLPLVPKTILVLVCIFIVVVAVSRYVALASVLTVALFPAVAWFLEPYRETPQMLTFMAASSILIIVRHHGNIRRLMAGTEPRFHGSGQ
ncbi:MAG TPA: glycerol-3-phosphate 1-O-acyltransferase PlsY [Terriglobales bacterium]